MSHNLSSSPLLWVINAIQFVHPVCLSKSRTQMQLYKLTFIAQIDSFIK